MLILGRKVNESLTIGEDVVVTVMAIKGDRVRLGIEAPMVVPVVRNELRERADRKGNPPEEATP